MDKDELSTIDWLVKVIPLGFQDAVGQNVGWLKERAKKEEKKKENERKNCSCVGFEK